MCIGRHSIDRGSVESRRGEAKYYYIETKLAQSPGRRGDDNNNPILGKGRREERRSLQGGAAAFNTRKGDKLSSSQAQLGSCLPHCSLVSLPFRSSILRYTLWSAAAARRYITWEFRMIVPTKEEINLLCRHPAVGGKCGNFMFSYVLTRQFVCFTHLVHSPATSF